jgi:2-oxoglutarate dehydrogenase dihydrolipoamide succinyltransferase (E2 component)
VSSSNTDLGAAAAAAPGDAGRSGDASEASVSPIGKTTVDVTMPQMGVSVAEGTIVAWHKRVGDWVNADETLCEISTDKIDTEVPSPASGRLVEILADLEQTVEVGAVLARIATDALAGEAHPDEEIAPAKDGAAQSGGQTPPAPGPAPAASEAPAQSAPARQEAAHGHYSPVVLRIAGAEGVDLSEVPGSGRGGRVQKRDVLAFIERRERERGAGAGAEQPPLHIESPYREEPAQADPPGAPGGERLSRMRRSIAQHMVDSLRTAAHCTTIGEADFSAVEKARAALSVSYLPFVARCVIDTLRIHPELNATLEGEIMTRHERVNLGIAVSLGADGLIVPVIHDAQELSVEGLARRIADLAQRARSGALSADEVHGGTFTITNPGGYGTLASTPIINQPQVAILDLEAVVKRPIVVSDADGRDSIAIRPMSYLCLSWDHRALDGALAAQFLRTLRGRIESWEVL